MVLRLYNSLGKKLTRFVPLSKGVVRMYTCGPTVWNYAHIGNFRTFVSEDLLRRYLIFKGYAVTQVKNITDVEDRIIEGMKRFGMSLKELTDFYTAEFMKDLEALNIQKAEYYPRATGHIEEMVALIEALRKSGYAYRGEDGSTYYDISKFDNYGRLSGIARSKLKTGVRVSLDHYEKAGMGDFALWKAWDEADGPVFWETTLGKGRPGWHIECSAMSMKYLGQTFDIHTGGKDLKFPHHENEIAQSEAATGRKFVRFWMHMEFLEVGGEKMAKSTGNIVTLRDLLKKGFTGRAIRLFLSSAHYREVLDLTDESVARAQANIAKIDEFVRRLTSIKGVTGDSKRVNAMAAGFLKDFTVAMDNDLNTPRAFATLFTFMRTVNTMIDQNKMTESGTASVLDALKKVDSVLGVMRFDWAEQELSGEQAQLIREREEARKRRDYAKADEIRESLRKQGIVLEDTPSGPSWRRAIS